jgi:WXG100 family type VII secretion target
MANLNVTYAEMENEAGALRSGRTEIESQLTALRNRIDNLVSSGFVTTSASGAFQNMYHEFTQGASQTIGALDNIAGSLSQMAQQLQETDEAMARGIRS